MSKNFLKRIALLHKKNETISILKGEKFNVFRLCKVNHYENLHSDIIAEFLNPDGSHGLGDIFLCLFCKIVNISYDNTQKTAIWREYSIPGGRLDVLIKNSNHLIIIENKIYASEGEKQIEKYDKWLKDNQRDGEIIFLTLDGHGASSCENSESYRPISYVYHIRKWLMECIKEAVNVPFVRESLKQYLNLINDLTGNNIGEKCMCEVLKEIISTQESFNAASLIYANFNRAKAQIIRDIWKNATPQGMMFSENLEAFSYPGVCYENEKKAYKIEFQFQRSNFRDLCYGLTYNGNRLKEKNIQIAGWGQSPWWFIWKYMKDEFRNWDDKFIVDYCYDKDKIEQEIANCLEELFKIIDDNKLNEFVDN